jgi:acetyl esterase/lipase
MISSPIRTLTVSYGPHPSQTADVYLPRGSGPHPVVALLHGGLWHASKDREAMRPIARHLAREGYAVLNLEYRRLGEQGAGWPGTFLDAVDGVSLVTRPLRTGRGSRETVLFDADRVAIVGHCSGGHLALWAAAWLCGLWLGDEWIGPTRREPGWDAPLDNPVAAGEAGPDPVGQPERIGVRAVVALAPVTDLRAAERDGIGTTGPRATASGRPSVVELLGGNPGAVAGRYRLGSPLDLLPVGSEVAQLLVHGDEDDVVPVDYSLRYARAAGLLGDRARVARFPGMDHFGMLDPEHEAFRLVLRHLGEHLDN